MNRTVTANFFINLLLILFFFWLLLSITSCRKEEAPKKDESRVSVNCTATKAVTEDLQWFPA